MSRWPLISMVADRAARRVCTIFLLLDGHAGGFLQATADCEGREHDGQVGFNGLARVVEDRPGAQVGLGHSEGPLRRAKGRGRH